MERDAEKSKDDPRTNLNGVLGKDLKGVSEVLEVFLEDHPEIQTYDELIIAIRLRINDVGSFQFTSSNPKCSGFIHSTHPEVPDDKMTFVVCESPLDATLNRIESHRNLISEI